MLPLINFEIQKYYQNEPKFNVVYSRSNLRKIKDGTYVIDLDEYKSIGTHWIALYVNANNIAYFDSFGVEHVPVIFSITKKMKNIYYFICGKYRKFEKPKTL